MLPRVDPLVAIDARLRDLSEQKRTDQPKHGSDAWKEIMWKFDLFLDRWLELTGRESNSGTSDIVPR